MSPLLLLCLLLSTLSSLLCSACSSLTVSLLLIANQSCDRCRQKKNRCQKSDVSDVCLQCFRAQVKDPSVCCTYVHETHQGRRSDLAKNVTVTPVPVKRAKVSNVVSNAAKTVTGRPEENCKVSSARSCKTSSARSCKTSSARSCKTSSARSSKTSSAQSSKTSSAQSYKASSTRSCKASVTPTCKASSTPSCTEVSAVTKPSEEWTFHNADHQVYHCTKCKATQLRVGVHSHFSSEHVVLLDLNFLPTEFLLPNQTNIKPYYNDMITRPKFVNTGNFGQHMRFQHFQNPKQHLPFDDKHSEFELLEALNHIFVVYGRKPPYQVANKDGNNSISLHNELCTSGFLSTVFEHQQKPHLDLKHESLNKFNKENKTLNETILPWSCDLPLTSGGLKLAFYGKHGAENLLKVPVLIEVPHRYALLWR